MTAASKKFRFVSPGVQIKEIDKSQLPKVPNAIGPVVIGRTQRGPGMYPVTVNDYVEFVETFGSPVRGGGSADVWRDGNTTSPTYAAYAAQAWLKNSSPLTVVRLLGVQHPNPTTTGFEQAGWKTENLNANGILPPSSNGGAYGLFIIPSSSTPAQNVTGSLAAIFYLDKGAIRLVGRDMVGNDVGQNGAAVFVQNVGSSYEFQAVIEDATAAQVLNTTFNFNPNSSKYIRKVFNTNPTMVNDDVTPSESLKTYWLGETFENYLRRTVSENSGNVAGKVYGTIVALENSTVAGADFKGVDAQPAKTGWIIGQHLSNTTGSYNPENMTKLFRLVVNRGDGSGEWEQGNIKISIFDIKSSVSEYYRYGTFTVGIRKIDDTDAAPQYLEVFTGCTLDPQSPNYIARKIGDKYVTWDTTEKRHISLGSNANVSKFVRVEMNPIVEQGGVEPELLPFGFFGPPRFSKISLVSGSTVAATALLKGSGSVPYAPDAGGGTVAFSSQLPAGTSAQLTFPSIQLRVSSSDAGTLRDSQAYFGIVTSKIGASKFDEDYRDLVRAKPDGVDSYVKDSNTENSFVFSLDDIVPVSGSSEQSYWLSGSRASGVSVTALGAAIITGSTDGYKRVLDRGHDKFTLPLFGGSDGLDITERDPFRNTFLAKGGGTERGNYAVHSITRALDAVLDPESLDMNLITIPGITHNGLTRKVLDVSEARADALGIIDLDGNYVPETENALEESLRLGSLSQTITNLKGRALNTSYGCAYYPWVQIRDQESGIPLWVPPSVVALGTMAFSDKQTNVWFAPAGFNRGGLTQGSSGLDVIGVRENLRSKDRDKLYEVNINPIASFPSEGIVIFGQKTLQATPSALDRINVRRLVLFLKKEISRISSRLMFDPNVDTTWNRFTGQVKPLLEKVKTGFGITSFKLVLDKTTTTPEEIDRNMMYAKIFIKPAYAIEFIGIDFVVTNTGASFEDL